MNQVQKYYEKIKVLKVKLLIMQQNQVVPVFRAVIILISIDLRIIFSLNLNQ